jgi:hypothetical protein
MDGESTLLILHTESSRQEVVYLEAQWMIFILRLLAVEQLEIMKAVITLSEMTPLSSWL